MVELLTDESSLRIRESESHSNEFFVFRRVPYLDRSYSLYSQLIYPLLVNIYLLDQYADDSQFLHAAPLHTMKPIDKNGSTYSNIREYILRYDKGQCIAIGGRQKDDEIPMDAIIRFKGCYHTKTSLTRRLL